MEAKPSQALEGMQATAGGDVVVRATTETIIGSVPSFRMQFPE